MIARLNIGSILILLLMGISAPVYAGNPLIIEPDNEHYSLGPHLDLLEDKEKKWTIEDVQEEVLSSRFSKSTQPVPNLGFTDSAYWVRFQMRSGFSSDEKWLLKLEYPLMDEIELYLPKSDGKFEKKQTGYNYPFQQRDVKSRHFVFNLGPLSRDLQTYYIRLENLDRMEVPLSLWSEKAFWENDHIEQYALGIYFGIMLIMIFYNLFVFFSTGLRAYLYYISYIFVFCLFMMTQNGTVYEYFWPASLSRFNHYIPQLQCILAFTGVVFSQSFLRTRTVCPRLDKLLNVVKIVSLCLVVLTLLINYSTAVIVVVLISIFGIVAILWAGTIGLVERSRPAMFFMLAWTAMLVCGIVLGLKVMGILPSNFFTNYAIQIGSVIEVTLLSIGLGDRINVLRKELAILNRDLEIKVEDRTQDLIIANEEMATLNENLVETTDALWGEMQLAKKIQTVLLPTNPSIPGYDISAHMAPSDDVGGDYYDIINIGGTDWLVIGDVSGHGVTAGLVMMMAQTAIRTALDQNPKQKPSELLSIVNRILRRSIVCLGEDKYMTIMVLAAIREGEFSFSGLHQNLHIFRSDTNSVDIVDHRGMWLGILDSIDNTVFDDSVILNRGDTMLLFTDGITEAQALQKDDTGEPPNSGLDLFGEDRLVDILKQTGHKSVGEVKDQILGSLEDYEIRDDITLVVVKRV